MATKRKRVHHKRKAVSHKRKTGLSAPGHKRKRRRRRIGAGDKMFKMFSDPMIGGLAGALAGIAIKKAVSKVAKDSQIAGIAASAAGAFFVRKKMPFVAAGIVGGAGASVIADFVAKQPADSIIHKLLSDDTNVHFVNDNLLSSNNPLILSENGDSMSPGALKDMILSELEDGAPYQGAQPQNLFQDSYLSMED